MARALPPAREPLPRPADDHHPVRLLRRRRTLHAPRFDPKTLVAELGPWRVFGLLLAAFVVVDLVLVLAVARRFRRDRLVAS